MAVGTAVAGLRDRQAVILRAPRCALAAVLIFNNVAEQYLGYRVEPDRGIPPR
jgi:hypothetical protein